MSILTERMTNDLDICAEQAIDSIISMIPSDTEMTGDETSDSDSSHHSMASPVCAGNIYSSFLPLAPITMHPRAINKVILSNKSSLEKFTLFLSINNDAKNLVEFWLACESLSKTKKDDYRKSSKSVYHRFIRSNAMQRVTLSKPSSDAIKSAFNHNGSLRSAMELAQLDAFNILQLEAFPQFKSTLYFQTLLKDPLFLSLCSVPPPPPSSVCSSSFSTQSSVCTKLSTDSSISPESEKSNHRHEIPHEDSISRTRYSRSKRHNEITNVEQFAPLIISQMEKEIENRIKLTREVQETLRNEGKLEEIINCADWTTHPVRIKYIQLSREPEESNTNVYDVIASTSEDIQYSFPNDSEMQAAFKCEPVFNSMQFMMNKQPQIESNIQQVRSSASDVLPMANAPYENIQINRFFQGIEAHENQPGRAKNACDAALQLLQNAHANMDVDSTTNWAERQSTQRKRRHSYHRSGSQRSLLSDTTSINSDSVASLPLRNSSRICYYPNRHDSNISENGSQIHYYATLPRKGTLQQLQQRHHQQQQQQQNQQYNELQVFYRVGENSEINLFTRVQHSSKTPFVLRDFIQKVFKRKGNFRYYFKSYSIDLDESVWEEISHEDFPVPFHNGKIMALVVPHPSS